MQSRIIPWLSLLLACVEGSYAATTNRGTSSSHTNSLTTRYSIIPFSDLHPQPQHTNTDSPPHSDIRSETDPITNPKAPLILPSTYVFSPLPPPPSPLPTALTTKPRNISAPSSFPNPFHVPRTQLTLYVRPGGEPINPNDSILAVTQALVGAFYVEVDGRTKNPRLPPSGISLVYNSIRITIQPSPPDGASVLGALTVTMAVETLKGVMLYMVSEGWRAALVEISHDVLGQVGAAGIGRAVKEGEGGEGEVEVL